MANNYYEIGTADDPVLSNSSLSYLNPEEGGSIQKFMSFFSQKEESKIALSLERGKLIHKYIEDKNSFIIAPETKPTEMLAGLLEQIVKFSDDLKKGITFQDVSNLLTSGAKKEETKEVEIKEIEPKIEILAQHLQTTKDNAIIAYNKARAVTQAYKARYDPAVVPSLIEAESIKYIKFLIGVRNKIVLSAADKNTIEGMITSLSTHPKVKAFLGLNLDNDFDSIIGETYNEVPIYWNEAIVDPISKKKITINCKALLDKVTVIHNNKKIKIKDLKSTSKSIYQYQKSFEYYHTYRQMAKYTRAIRFWFTSMFPDKNFSEYSIEVYMIPVETFGFYQTTIVPVQEPWIFKGRQEVKSLWERYAFHKVSGEYTYSLEEVTNDGFLKLTNPQI